MEVRGTLNAADDIEKGEFFLTVTGTSAEAGDDGQVGRGNRVSGLITPYRPTTMEAAAGKNPVTHVGKLYNLAATRIANRLVRDVAGIAGASCVLVSQIGHSIDDPQIADLQLAVDSGLSLGAIRPQVQKLATAELQRFSEIQAELLSGSIRVY